MKAVLDHVGIAVSDLSAALAFYRDALGLHVETPEEVLSQRVRAHFIPVGGATLELLEATAPTSAIARFVEKRGPGLHHIAISVTPEKWAALRANLEATGVEYIGESGASLYFRDPDGARLELLADPLGEMYGSHVL